MVLVFMCGVIGCSQEHSTWLSVLLSGDRGSTGMCGGGVSGSAFTVSLGGSGSFSLMSASIFLSFVHGNQESFLLQESVVVVF